MECKICKGKDFTYVFNECICEQCGAIYDMEELEIVKDFDKAKLFKYGMSRINKIEDEKIREYVKGLFLGYYDALVKAEWKKVREWAVMKLEDLLMKINTEMVKE